jgi:hypothetical protein
VNALSHHKLNTLLFYNNAALLISIVVHSVFPNISHALSFPLLFIPNHPVVYASSVSNNLNIMLPSFCISLCVFQFFTQALSADVIGTPLVFLPSVP